MNDGRHQNGRRKTTAAIGSGPHAAPVTPCTAPTTTTRYRNCPTFTTLYPLHTTTATHWPRSPPYHTTPHTLPPRTLPTHTHTTHTYATFTCYILIVTAFTHTTHIHAPLHTHTPHLHVCGSLHPLPRAGWFVTAYAPFMLPPPVYAAHGAFSSRRTAHTGPHHCGACVCCPFWATCAAPPYVRLYAVARHTGSTFYLPRVHTTHRATCLHRARRARVACFSAPRQFAFQLPGFVSAFYCSDDLHLRLLHRT